MDAGENKVKDCRRALVLPGEYRVVAG